ncbi:MAG: IS66 family insertion sequence element accessory protein TnpB [Loktanella sp.]|nr:IS66 family insertion sequence element accessory protein TnpB [Loktanella sp.]
MRVLVSTQPVDFRKGHDGLAAIVSSVLRKDPFTGTVFVFRSRRADRLKLLYWDGTGLVMAYKRFEPPRVYRRVKHSKDEPYDKEATYHRLSGRTA